ncbi:ABC transporter ATP-binding protein [Clostridium frigidicarnis]|uniref:Iron complex transport system ATP-binding protein n=1 Tax=Clostridium frigidicarnis TaxID=84698 RepID=A0A1I0XJC8_9CLOT|nr:ATP-binding cassette domain-containing protein [Clostridium frigidicarnis]SFB00420.1 iron complex transport system ATP-binding protein [Clostridium frigidicarnis]
MIEIKNLTKQYGNKNVVDNVSFNIERGKITSLIGPNGAGKSTLLSMIAPILERDWGQVLIDGKEMKEWDSKEFAKKVAILKQSNNINIRLTIKELVEFGRYPHCEGKLTKEDKIHVNKAIEYMKIKDIENKYLDELSGGQRQRAYIAMVIAQNTEYILLDEPLNNLDMKHSVQMMKVLRNLVDELQKTVVIVMHDINFASCYSDNIVILKDGKLIKNSDTDSIINKELLEEIYEIDFDIKNINGNKICVYFCNEYCKRREI